MKLTKEQSRVIHSRLKEVIGGDADLIDFEGVFSLGVSGDDKTLEQHREEFEEWAAANELNLQLSPYGGYEKGYTLEAWAAWKAARGIAE